MEPLSGQATLRIGLTGGIGSGKSTAAAALVAQGAQLIDADAIARALTAPGGAALPTLRETFGDSILDAQGALDRAAMRERAFADAAVRRRLEAVLHPLIGIQALQQAQRSTARLLVFDVPLLAESSQWRARVHRILVLDCDEATQVERVARRPGWTRELAQLVVVAQSPRSARRALADAVIHNDGMTGIAQLQDAVAALVKLWNNGGGDAMEQ